MTNELTTRMAELATQYTEALVQYHAARQYVLELPNSAPDEMHRQADRSVRAAMDHMYSLHNEMDEVAKELAKMV